MLKVHRERELKEKKTFYNRDKGLYTRTYRYMCVQVRLSVCVFYSMGINFIIIY